MEFKKPKPKKNSVPKESLTFPLERDNKVIGIFDGQTVSVRDMDSMSYLYDVGSFGKGSLSKGKPDYHIMRDDIPKLMFQHQFENLAKYTTNIECPQKSSLPLKNDFKLSIRDVQNFLQSSFSSYEQGSWKSWKESHNLQSKKINKKIDTQNKELNLLEFKNEDAEYKDEDFISFVNKILELRQIRKPKLQNLKTEVTILNTSFNPNAYDLSPANVNARLGRLAFGVEESLKLCLEESLFLKCILGYLNIMDLNLSEMGIPELWEKFNAANSTFRERYITYHYYRAKDWVVKSGLKFGGDYLLYKDGPAHYHASYLVKVLDKGKKITWREFLGMNRLVETFNKDLVLTNIFPTQALECESFHDVLTGHSVQEVLVRRWFPSKERFSKADKSST